VVGVATHYGLDGPGIESQLRARFSAPVHTSPGAHPASDIMGTRSLSPGVNRPGCGIDHPPPLNTEIKKSRAIPLLPLWAPSPRSLSRVNFAFTSKYLSC